MVQYGVYLESFRNPAWAEHYLSYGPLKALIYDLKTALDARKSSDDLIEKQSDLPEGATFEQALDDNLVKIDRFYSTKVAFLTQAFEDLQAKLANGIAHLSQPEQAELRKQFHDLYIELQLLRDFSSLNYTGYSKLLKKHDKVLPMFKMKGKYFKTKVNKVEVFGTLESLCSLQVRIQNLYAELFEEYNRIDTEISFGEALAKTTESIAKARQLEAGHNAPAKKAQLGPTYLMGDGNDFIQSQNLPEKKKELNLTNTVWQRASTTMAAVKFFSSQRSLFTRQLIIALALVMIGGIGQSLFLEAMVRVDPGCGPTITFFSFLFITLQGLKDFVYIRPYIDTTGKEVQPPTLWSKTIHLSMKPRKIHIAYHAGCVVMSWLSAVLSSQAYRYNISVPFHMVFKSGILLVNMFIGMILLRKKYNVGQVASILLLTVGVFLTTMASLPKNQTADTASGEVDTLNWYFGIGILALSLVFTGLLGILQDLSYKTYGQHWQEALFYAHLLGLPLFLSMGTEIYEHSMLWLQSHPFMWFYLLMNIVTTSLGVNGVYKVTGLTSSLTGNLTITVRKFISLLLSVMYFKNDFTLLHWLGAIGVLAGTMFYTKATQAAAAQANKKKD